MNNPNIASPTSHSNSAPKQYTLRTGQQNGVKGHREGKSGNRQDRNPDGSQNRHQSNKQNS